jgi:iron complex transport system substrate-binding protein
MKIVSLLSSATEILFGLGLGEQVVAVSHECDYPPPATRLPRATRSLIDSTRPSQEIDQQVQRLMAAGETLYELDRDLILRLAPDLIVTQAQCDVCAVRYQDVVDFVHAEPRLASTQVVALLPSSVVDVLEDIRRVGRAAGQAEAGGQYAAALKERLMKIARRTGSAWPNAKPPRAGDPSDSTSPRPTIVCLEWTEPLMGAGNWTPELIELAGGVSCLAEWGRHSRYVEWAAVRETNPDVLIVAPCGFDLARSTTEAQRLFELPGFRELGAIRSGRTFVIDGNAYLNRSGPRLVETVELLAHLIRPEIFEPPTAELSEGRAWSRLTIS